MAGNIARELEDTISSISCDSVEKDEPINVFSARVAEAEREWSHKVRETHGGHLPKNIQDRIWYIASASNRTNYALIESMFKEIVALIADANDVNE